MSRMVRLTNVCEFIDPDSSDFELSESSGEEWQPEKGESYEDEEETFRKKSKKRKKLTRRQFVESDDSGEDIPLAQLANQSFESEDDLPLADFLEDDVPLAQIADTLQAMETPDAEELDELAAILDQPMWADLPFIPPESTKFKGTLEELPQDENIQTPYNYFKSLISDKMLQTVEENSNTYALQKTGIQLKTTKKEVEIFIGIYLRMGLVQANSVRAYWQTSTRYEPVAGSMSRDRFRKMATLLHFTDNTNATEKTMDDKVWKLRPWLNDLRSNLLQIVPEEHQAIDEIMVPFKGKSSIKQYMRGKPHPWGFKLWGRAGVSGILYDFDVYQGSKLKDGKKQQHSPLGLGGDVVMQMTSALPEGQNFKIFADNFFTSLQLVKSLKEKDLLFVGTYRTNRIKGCNLKCEKHLKSEGRGSSDQKVEVGSNIVVVRWFDNKSVDLVSSYIGKEPVAEVDRYDKKEKRRMKVPCPAIVAEYNKFMGGIDLLDALTALYKYPMKSRRWYFYIFLHTIHIAVVTSWLLYKRHCRLLCVKPMKLSLFQGDIASALIHTKRPGRPSHSTLTLTPREPLSNRPVDDVRLDGIGHLPVWMERNQCKQPGCSAKTFVQCKKCCIHLCFNKDRNCFCEFHEKK